jgi:HTH-type transcriptional regulator / antitoxin HipB
MAPPLHQEATRVAAAFAARIRARRRELDLSQIQLAELAGVGPDFLYDLERGKPSVRLDKLIAVLEVLNLTLTLDTKEEGFKTEPGAWIEKNS